MDGAITTGIVRERQMPPAVTSPAPNVDEPASGGNILSRAWRLIAGSGARQKAAEGSPS
jgi:hypothetical protein